MIPNVIHYCWFGGAPLPEDALYCINSWKKYFPGFEIKQWDESNFDVNCCNYVREAYQSKKWAYVSDYARLKILYDEGGLYFDTDVEVIGSFDSILKYGSFFGTEKNLEVSKLSLDVNAVNPGLGFAVEKNNPIIYRLLETYQEDHFIDSYGMQNLYTIVSRTTELMKELGYDEMSSNVQNINGIHIYPRDYFCPLDYVTGELKCTNNSVSIHHYTASWLSPVQKKINYINNRFSQKTKTIGKVGRLITIPLIIVDKIQTAGFRNTIKLIASKIKHNPS